MISYYLFSLETLNHKLNCVSRALYSTDGNILIRRLNFLVTNLDDPISSTVKQKSVLHICSDLEQCTFNGVTNSFFIHHTIVDPYDQQDYWE